VLCGCLGTYKTIEGSVANVLGQLVAASILYFIGKHITLVWAFMKGVKVHSYLFFFISYRSTDYLSTASLASTGGCVFNDCPIRSIHCTE